MHRQKTNLLIAALAFASPLWAGSIAHATTTVSSQVCSTAPPATISVPNGGYTGSTNPVYFQGQAEADANLTVFDNNVAATTATVPHSGIYVVPVYLQPGQHQFYVEATDSCGETVKSPTVTTTQLVPPAFPQPAQAIPETTADDDGSQEPLQVATTAEEPQPTLSYNFGTGFGGTAKPPASSGNSQTAPDTSPPANSLTDTQRQALAGIAAISGGVALGYLVLAGEVALIMHKISTWLR